MNKIIIKLYQLKNILIKKLKEKNGDESVGKAIWIVIAIVLGGIFLMWGIPFLKERFLPQTEDSVMRMFDYGS